MKNRKTRRPGQPESPASVRTPDDTDFRRRKFVVALTIMAIGMLLAIAWAAVQGWGLNRHYPYDTFLFTPVDRFNDYSDSIIDAGRDNPYLDLYGVYLPFAWVFFRAMSALPYLSGLTVFLFAGLAALLILAIAALERTIARPWHRVQLAFAFLALSYPVLITVDRANLELYVAALVAAALYFNGRAKYGLAATCLVLSVSFKFYAALFFLLFLRQRRAAWIAGSVLACALILYGSLWALGLPMKTGLEYYERNLVFHDWVSIRENYSLEGCSSLWNVYKVGLITAAWWGWMAPVDFRFDNGFVAHSATVYSLLTGLAGAGLAVFVVFVEKEFLRCAGVLLLYLSVFTPLGADYRLLYANIALLALVVAPARRPHDLTTIVLLALAMVPKKEIFLTYAGHTESNTADVSIQVVLNPLLATAALAFLVYDGIRLYDPRWTRLRWRMLLRSLLPATSRRSQKMLARVLP